MMSERAPRRRRTCADRMRQQILLNQRRQHRDPASKVVLQLLAILAAGIALLPPLPSLPRSWLPRHSRPIHRTSSSQGGVVRRQPDRAASRSLKPRCDEHLQHHNNWYCIGDDDERGPTAWAMERGFDPPYYRTSSRAAPTWSRLVKDLKRPRTREKAAELLECRVPAAALEWLRNCIQMEEWSSLRQVGRGGMGDDEIAAAAITQARRWEHDLKNVSGPGTDPDPDDSGSPGSGAALKP